MTILVALGEALRAIVEPKAKARQQARKGNQPGGNSENFTDLPEAEKGSTRDIIGKAIGMSGPTYQRAKVVA